MLYHRLGLTSKAVLNLHTLFQQQTMIDKKPITLRSAQMFLKGEITPKNGFNNFLATLDAHIDTYASIIVNEHKSKTLSLVSFSDENELWCEHESLRGCPLELYMCLLSRVITIARTKGIKTAFIPQEHSDDVDWKISYNLALPILLLMKEFSSSSRFI